MHLGKTLLTATVLLIFTSCVDPLLLTASYPNESYGPDERNLMDVYLPSERSNATEVLMLIHGGGWVAGHKTNWAPEMIQGFLDKGFAVVSINYRYACGDFHKQMQDIDLAIQHVRERADQWKISKQRFALMGGSAGGHLSLLYGHAYDSLHVVKCIISLAGPTDLSDTLFHRYARNYSIYFVFSQLLGASFENDPQVFKDASPLFNRGNVPTLFLHGKKDDLVPPQQAILMHDSLAADGTPTDILITEEGGHEVFGKDSKYYHAVMQKINQWIFTYLDAR